jgi:hypothetical protein
MELHSFILKVKYLNKLMKNASRSDVDFKEFCLQVLFECVSKDRPALLQVMYLEREA